MSKIISHNVHKWKHDKISRYQEVAPRDYYDEEDLERVLILYLQIIFPEFKVFKFKQKLTNLLTSKVSAADLGMVKNDYTEWYIIEVELGRHNLNHVLEQVETFRNFAPSAVNSKYIYDQRKSLFDLNKLTNLIVNQLPNLMVIVNEYKGDWIKPLSILSCKMCVFQIYHDSQGNRMYRLDGEFPAIYTDFCNCKYLKALPNTIRILKSNFLEDYGVKDGDKVLIQFNGVNYVWERQDAGGEVYLICESDLPSLDPSLSRYKLLYRPIPPTKKLMRLGALLNINKHIFTPFSFVKD